MKSESTRPHTNLPIHIIYLIYKTVFCLYLFAIDININHPHTKTSVIELHGSEANFWQKAAAIWGFCPAVAGFLSVIGIETLTNLY